MLKSDSIVLITWAKKPVAPFTYYFPCLYCIDQHASNMPFVEVKLITILSTELNLLALTINLSSIPP